jgi:hypothetical protein
MAARNAPASATDATQQQFALDKGKAVTAAPDQWAKSK